MDPEVAKELFHQGATLLFLDVPEGTEFGIDYNSWTVGPKFKGVKMIPPGIHFVYYSSVGNNRQASPRTGFFYNFQRQEVLIRKWDAQSEDMETGEVPADEQERYEARKMELDPFLGPYPYERFKKWVSLSSHITEELVKKIQPLSGKISAVAQFQSQGSNTRERLEELARQQEHMETSSDSPGKLPDMKEVPGTEIRFTEIPKKKFPDGATPGEITKYSIDNSYMLRTLLDKEYEYANSLLGELQLAFICFLIGQNLEAFEQWKRLVQLLCSCDEALSSHAELFKQFISTIHYHIQEVPEDFFIDIVSQNNFLTITLQEFFSNVEASDSEPQLKAKASKFCDHLQRKFKWDFTTEPDEYAPAIVE